MNKTKLQNDKLENSSKKILTRTLSSSYSITIPKVIRDILNLKKGDEITISLKSKELVIQKLNRETLENKMILNDRGSIRIPAEIRNLLFLKKGDIFNLYLTGNKQCILLRKNEKE
ncbi:AbrB/MazE/SpoVT family DNA-binding domain-containing protein [Oceanobacillus profundus]|uniref:AbrB/MazE/SpoVT family DNA-binding domain-containing protein n=1 Tax=Oceanobacillus profundus TaxID=372463 RepID=UPI0026E3455D|nr:AbrB/MazE/SpoVT family DNA-binding domain-containing protein [Oceanobacillus profundus]MDO6449449.1 AbrB/MazE/SpoVT family DNA-binding domain-containing protein [Oceanobacillus profundus]